MEVVVGTAEDTETRTTKTVGGQFRIQRMKQTMESVGDTGLEYKELSRLWKL